METINLYIQPKMEQKCQAHNLKVVGTNPTPRNQLFINNINILTFLVVFFCKYKIATFIATFKFTENSLYTVTALFY